MLFGQIAWYCRLLILSWLVDRRYDMVRLQHDERGDVTLEWVIVVAIVLAIVGTSILAVVTALAGRFQAFAGGL
jgi:Flp pilus assembly pilin Flp